VTNVRMRASSSSILAVMTVMATATGCSDCGGRLDESDAEADVSDAASEPLDTLCMPGPFGTPTPVTELNTTVNESGFRASPNELVAVFVRLASTASDASSYNDIYSTSRPTAAAPFAAPSVAQMNLSGDEQVYVQRYPSLTADTLSLFFESVCVSSGDPPSQGPLCLATRIPDGGAFGEGGLNDFVNYNMLPLSGSGGSFGADQGFYAFPGWSVGDGFVTSDGLRYYAVGLETADGGGPAISTDEQTDAGLIVHSSIEAGITNAIFITPGAMSSPYAYTFSSTFNGPIFVPSDLTVLVDNPVLSSDELTMFVSTTSTTSPVPHIQSATRASMSANFGPLTPSHELDSAEGEYPTWISPDQCRLYLTRTVGGQTDIYKASRSAH